MACGCAASGGNRVRITAQHACSYHPATQRYGFARALCKLSVIFELQGHAVNPMRILLLSACLFVGGVAQAANDLPGGGIDAEALSRHVRLLASDDFEGRAPASAGEQRTVDYLVEQFKAAGVQPGGEQGGWTQAVPLVLSLIHI